MRYEVVDRIHLSHCGASVDLVKGEGTKKFFVRKKLIRTIQINDQQWNRFLQEVEVLRHLQDIPGIVKLHEVHHKTNCVIIYTEYWEMGDLLSVVDRKEINVEQLGYVFYQIIAAISRMHEMGISHRDIKLENIFLRKSRIYKGMFDACLGDFGLCAVGNMRESRVGTLLYAAPEIHTPGKTYDPFLADAWSLGVTMYTAFYERLPWLSENIDELLDAIFSNQILSFYSSRSIPVGIPIAIKMLMNPDTESRMTVCDLKKTLLFDLFLPLNFLSHEEHPELPVSKSFGELNSAHRIHEEYDADDETTEGSPRPKAKHKKSKPHFNTLPRGTTPTTDSNGEKKEKGKEKKPMFSIFKRISPRNKKVI